MKAGETYQKLARILKNHFPGVKCEVFLPQIREIENVPAVA